MHTVETENGPISRGSQSGVSMVRDRWWKGFTEKVRLEFRPVYSCFEPNIYIFAIVKITVCYEGSKHIRSDVVFEQFADDFIRSWLLCSC